MCPRSVSAYSRLNDSLNEILFDGRFCDLPVYIDVEGDLKTEICDKLGLEEDQLTEYVGEVVSETLEWRDHNDIYVWHVRNHILWDLDNTKPPPFTALLLALSIAAENMGADEDISAINFYGRVAEIFGDVSYKNQISKYSKTTVRFWNDLNNWLIENDFLYGRPTAQPIIPKWKFASYALSQALVRRSDRDSFHRLFDEYNLSKSDQLTHPEIEPYINDWINGPGSTVLLKKIWKSSHLRHRVIEAALEELDTWHSQRKTLGQKQSGRLVWILQFQSYPTKKAKIKLCVAHETDDDNYRLFSRDFQSTDQKLIAESLSLSHFDGQDISFLGPTISLQLEELMLSDLVLNNGNTQSFERKHRSIIPLLKQDNGYFYKEVSQILLFHEYHILCASSWKEKVSSFLDTYGASGYQIMDSRANNGLPLGWCLFSSVEIVKAPKDSEIHDDLYALIPSERGLAFYPSGGLKLSGAGDIWHKWAPPSIFAVNTGAPLGLRVSSTDSDKENFEIEVDDSVEQPNFLYKDGRSILSSLQSERFSFTVYGENSKAKKTEKTFIFRSADSPKQHAIDSSWQLKYVVSKSDQELALTSASEHDSDCYLMGFDTSKLNLKESKSYPNLYKTKPFLANYNINDSDEIDDSYQARYGSNNTPVCIQRGIHAWRMPYGVTSKTKRAIQECADCGIRGIYRGKKSAPKSIAKKQNIAMRNSDFGERRLKPHRLFQPITHDVLLDAVSYQGQGSGQLLYKWFGLLVDEPWKIREVIKDYVDLGFIDIDMDHDSSRIKKWSVSPSVFVINEQGFGFLSGFRSKLLVDKVCKSLADLGLSQSIKSFESQPMLYAWEIDDKDAVIKKLTSLDLPRKLSVIENPSHKILAHMPTRQTIIDNFKSITPQLLKLQKFNLSSASWQDWQGILSTGAYRCNHFPRRYFFMDKESIAKQMSYEMAKITAANDEGIRLHEYDALSEEFSCVLGCKLPGLYERVLISCSGILPDMVDGKTMIYKKVPLGVGHGILEKIYG